MRDWRCACPGLGNNASAEYALFYHSLQSELADRLHVNASQLVLSNLVILGSGRHLLAMDVRPRTTALPSISALHVAVLAVRHAAQVPIIDGFIPVEDIPQQWRKMPQVVRREDSSAGSSEPAAGRGGAMRVMHTRRHALHHGRTLLQTSNAPQMTHEVQAAVHVMPPLQPGSTYAQLAGQLTSTLGSSAPDSAAQVTGVYGIAKRGYPGNGFCEIGELPTPAFSGAHSCKSTRFMTYPLLHADVQHNCGFALQASPWIASSRIARCQPPWMAGPAAGAACPCRPPAAASATPATAAWHARPARMASP